MYTPVLSHPTQTEVIERIMAEGAIGATDAGKSVGRHACTIVRWALDGIPLADGTRLYLEYFRLSGKIR
jgi:hypothetical protein